MATTMSRLRYIDISDSERNNSWRDIEPESRFDVSLDGGKVSSSNELSGNSLGPQRA